MSALSPQLINDDDNQLRRQEISTPSKRPLDMPSGFVLGRPHTGPGRGNDNRQYPNGTVAAYPPVTDAEHSLSLLDHLAADLANLLNRTDISDCFLNVQGTFMAVHKCILAARSNAFAGKHTIEKRERSMNCVFF